MKVSIIIPCYNEEESIERVLKQVLAVKLPIEKEVIVVDDGSTDRSAELTQKFNDVTLVRHEINRGKGVAIRTGVEKANGDIAIIQDADLEYDPKDIPALIEPILTGDADVVLGSRFKKGVKGMSFSHNISNKAISFFTSILLGVEITDVMTGYKAFKTEAYKKLTLDSSEFEVETELVAKFASKGLRIIEVPIEYQIRPYGKAKIGWRHGFLSLHTLFKNGLSCFIKRLFSFTKTWQWMIWLIIFIGVISRLSQYFFNRSLWVDESALALNIINRSFLELLKPLEPFQVAPIGFLIVEWLSVQLFNNSEYSLRLFPLLSGIISLFLFYKVASHFIRGKAVLIALGLFAISAPLIYYSSEVKQYSSDVTVALILYLMAIYVHSREFSIRRVVIFGFIGAIAIWFSHPSIFVLGGIGITLFFSNFLKKNWTRIRYLSMAYSVWALSFIGFYLFSLRTLATEERLLNFWSMSFMPMPPSSISDVKWFFEFFLRFGYFAWVYRPVIHFINWYGQIGLYVYVSLALTMIFTFVIGCICILRQEKQTFIILFLPGVLALLASGFQKYPFYERFLLFLIPSLILFIAVGVEEVRHRTRNHIPLVGVVLIALVFFHPVLFAGYHLVHPITKEEIKPVINYTMKNQQQGDVLYLYYGSQYPFKYYSEYYGFDNCNCIIGISSRDNLENYEKDLDQLRGNRRVWILFSHVYDDEEAFFIDYLDSIGMRLDSFKSPGAAVYLYDLDK